MRTPSVATSIPLSVVVEVTTFHGRHLAAPHVPERQLCPQLPQFRASVFMSTQAALQRAVPLLHAQVPAVHVLLVPHAVVSGAFGDEQTPVDGLQTPAAWQTAVDVQVTGAAPVHVPLRQVSVLVHALPSLQVAPLPRAVPRSLHAGVPVVQSMAPLWQALTGVHGALATQRPHAPLAHTPASPQGVPSSASDAFTHDSTLPLHAVAPTSHAPSVQGRPAWQAAAESAPESVPESAETPPDWPPDPLAPVPPVPA
jgi:hypothetical protein